jgi:DNA end-binding protein Ku
MRAIWKGTISFGMVSIPVKLYTATRDKAVDFRMLCGECRTPLHYKKYCPKCEEEVREIQRGFEVEKGKFVVLTEEDFKKIPLKTTKTMDIKGFVDPGEIDVLFYNKFYYTVPVEGGEKAYFLLKEAMASMNKIAVGKIIMRNKEYLAILKAHGEGLILATLHYPEEIRKEEGLERVKLEPEELKLAEELIGMMATRFRPEEFRDEYRDALMKIITAKLEGKKVEKIPEVEVTKDLMNALKASIEAKK